MSHVATRALCLKLFHFPFVSPGREEEEAHTRTETQGEGEPEAQTINSLDSARLKWRERKPNSEICRSDLKFGWSPRHGRLALLAPSHSYSGKARSRPLPLDCARK